MRRLLFKTSAFPLLLVLFLAWGDSNAQTCPDDAPALTPATLQEEWAVEWWMPRHEAKLTEEGREDARLLFIGNSITHGWENTGKEVWNEYYADYGGYNIGFSGDRTENVLWRFEHGELDGIHPELAILMIGTNNTGHRQDPAACTAKGIEMILDEIKERLPETEILLLAIFPRETSPDGELRQLNNKINERIEKFADGERVHFLNINDVFLDEEGVLSEDIMPDLLHPNEYGYQLWAEAMQPKLEELIDF
ncbi:MAG: platelet-activating factor acetylhydrolase IB subunit [Balneolaceae bacterium]|nr:platelet-activating factor acetylhydrolase IB subunit [Balneolaceae bacterium]